MHDEQFDVVVAGGGPGGATAAATLAKNGHRVLLLEKERFPRFVAGHPIAGHPIALFPVPLRLFHAKTLHDRARSAAPP